MSAAVQTSAQADHAEWTGTLLHTAEARTKVLDNEGHAVPVLCMDVELDNVMHTRMRVEQPFQGTHEQAQIAAHRLKKGMRIKVLAPLVGIRLLATNATHIHVIQTEEEQPCLL